MGDSIQLTASGANLYLWSSNNFDLLLPPQNTFSNPIVAPIIKTLYKVLGTDINGCKNSDSAYVNINPVPTPIIGATPNPTLITDPKVYFSDISGTASTWLWYTGDGGTSNQNGFYYTYSDLDTGRYLVRLIVSDSVGCIDSTSLWVIVSPDTRIFVPNAFTPGKTLNNVFKVYGSGILPFFNGNL